MPQLQLGLYMMSRHEVLSSVPRALDLGYRGFDCAQMYHNEREAGSAISSWLLDNASGSGGGKLTRGDIFYTSKLASNSENYDAVRKSIRKSVEAVSGEGMGTGTGKGGYIDLFLLHSPYGGPEARRESWRAVEDAITDGEVRSGGVSNFGVRHVSSSLLFLFFNFYSSAFCLHSFICCLDSLPYYGELPLTGLGVLIPIPIPIRWSKINPTYSLREHV